MPMPAAERTHCCRTQFGPERDVGVGVLRKGTAEQGQPVQQERAHLRSNVLTIRDGDVQELHLEDPRATGQHT